MASIYDWTTGDEITTGLEEPAGSDQAMQTARRIAARRGEPVVLSTEDGEWIVEPTGRVRRGTETRP